jgi:hypothetical protein
MGLTVEGAYSSRTKGVPTGSYLTDFNNNLFDEKYSDPGSTEHIQDLIKQDGRAFRVKLTYAF